MLKDGIIERLHADCYKGKLIAVGEMIKTVLKSFLIFQGLNDSELSEIANCSKLERYYDGDVIFNEGDRGICFYIIVDGTAKVVKKRNNNEIVLSILKKGDFFGELALIDGNMRSASVESLENLTCVSISNDGFKKVFNNSVSTLRVLEMLSQRLRKTNEYLIDLFFNDDNMRIISTFKQLGERNGSRIRLAERLTREEIIQVSGMNREKGIEILDLLETMGVLDYDKGYPYIEISNLIRE